MQLPEIAEAIRQRTADIDGLKAEIHHNENLRYPGWELDNKRFLAVIDVLYQLADSMEQGHEQVTPETTK